MWVNYDPSAIEVKKEYIEFDGPFDPIPIGLTLTVPLSMLQYTFLDNPSTLMSYCAMAEYPGAGTFDFAPDTGLTTVMVKPLPPEGLAGDVDNDDDVDLYDLATLSSNWLVGTQP